MNLPFFILFIGLILIICGYAKQITNNEKNIEIKYIPRCIYDELVMNSVITLVFFLLLRFAFCIFFTCFTPMKKDNFVGQNVPD